MHKKTIEHSNKYLIVIAGPTAVGKTDLCVKLAQLFDTEILSADSRQIYKELAIGTAKPTIAEMKGVKHHFVDSHSITNYYSVGDYEKECLTAINKIFETKNIAILTGGSGLFIKVITEGIDEMPELDLELREKIASNVKREGIAYLQKQLAILDPEYFNQADQHNTQRMARALEVCLSSGKPFSSFRIKNTAERPFNIIKIGLERERESLYSRINHRMDLMLEAGLAQEALSVLSFREHYALKTVGYREVFEHFDGKYDYSEMVRLLKRNTRRFAKKQLTWFKNQDDFEWFDACNEKEIINFILQQTNLSQTQIGL